MLKITITIESPPGPARAATDRTVGGVGRLEDALASLASMFQSAPAAQAPPAPARPFDPEAANMPGPAEPTVENSAAAKENARRQAKLTQGYEAFAGLLNTWMQNFGKEGPQPDRGGALLTLANGPLAGPVVTYVIACGGLRAAVRACVPVSKRRQNQDALAENICQVASVLFPELAEQLELVSRVDVAS